MWKVPLSLGDFSDQFRKLVFFSLRFYLFIFLEKERRRRERKTLIGCLSQAPKWGPGPQPRHVPWPRIKLPTFQFTGWHSKSTPTRAEIGFLKAEYSNTQWEVFINHHPSPWGGNAIASLETTGLRGVLVLHRLTCEHPSKARDCVSYFFTLQPLLEGKKKPRLVWNLTDRFQAMRWSK